MRRFFLCLALIATAAALPAQQLTLPRQPGSIQFAVIGDMGTGRTPQYQLAARMETLRHTFPFDFVITLGDNIYGGSGPNDFLTKFELPYKALLDAGVKFYASLGNHDGTEQSLYKGQDAILCVGQQLPESRAAVLAREGIAELNGGLEDPLFPPSALFVRPQTWI